MSYNITQIKSNYLSIKGDLQKIASDIETHLFEIFNGGANIDKINCRIKSEESFLKKATKMEGAGPKYKVPFREIQDIIGARIVVFYKSDVDYISREIDKFFQRVEHREIIPDDVNKFGYEGVHKICFIPSTIYSNHDNKLIPDFFELQIKTLYQHAWGQTVHDLGYKPGRALSYEEEKKFAFLAAQSWGADMILEEFLKK